jgi:hypothetical protein
VLHRHSIPNRRPLPGTHPQPLRLDVERYRAHLEGLDLTEEQAAEVLKTLWTIVEAFVDEAFGVDSFSLARPQAGSVRPPEVGAAANPSLRR